MLHMNALLSFPKRPRGVPLLGPRPRGSWTRLTHPVVSDVGFGFPGPPTWGLEGEQPMFQGLRLRKARH